MPQRAGPPRRLVAPLLAAAIVAAGTAARAGAGELAFSPTMSGAWSRYDGGEADALDRGALLGGLGLRYGLSDFWQLAGQLRGGPGLGQGHAVSGVGHALVEVRYVIDALTWVPYLAAGGGGLIRGPAPGSTDPRGDLTLHVGLGVEYRPKRRWSLGLAGRVHFLPTSLDRSQGPWEITLSWNLYIF